MLHLVAQTDLLIQKYNKLDMSKAVILQACAATVIEAYCDEQQDFMKEEAGKQGLYLRLVSVPAMEIFLLPIKKTYWVS